MTAAALGVLAAAFIVAYANGANDVSKGIATLAGSGVADYRRAILWGTLWTGAGALSGALCAGAMVATFGSGLLAAGTEATFAAALGVLLGAAAWVLLATRLALPVSTTHAVVGAVLGVALAAHGASSVAWARIGGTIALPLAVSPLVSLGATVLIFRALRAAGARGEGPGALAAADCACASVEPEVALVPTGAAGAAVAVAAGAPAGRLRLTVAPAEACPPAGTAGTLRLTRDDLHWLTAGATSFARGMNDAPKLVAIALAASALGGGAATQDAVFGVVAVGMVAGSLAAGQRVTEVLAERVTPMSHGEGFGANLVTAALVTAGAVLGLPMSTTHVSSGAIIGLGIERGWGPPGAGKGALNRRTVRDMLLAWAVTLPAAALLGAAAFGALSLVRGPGGPA